MGLGRATPDHPAHPVSQTFEQASQDVTIFRGHVNIGNFMSRIRRMFTLAVADVVALMLRERTLLACWSPHSAATNFCLTPFRRFISALM